MKQSAHICDLQSCFLCSNCLPAWQLAVAHHKVNRKIKKGAQVFSEGAPVEGIFFLYSGTVKIHKQWGSEKELIVSFARQGDIVGYRGWGKDMQYPVSATALEDVVMCFIDIDFFEATLQANHNLTYEFMKFYAGELQDAERRMRDLALMDVKGRVADMLLMLKKKFGTDKQGFIDIVLTRQDMASYSGTTYETFFRMINELEREKLIRVSGKQIAILKEKQLEALTLFAG